MSNDGIREEEEAEAQDEERERGEERRDRKGGREGLEAFKSEINM